MKIEALLKTFVMVGVDLPAYKALFEQVVDLFEEEDQATLKLAYAQAVYAADAAHKQAQKLASVSYAERGGKLSNQPGINDVEF